MAHSVSRKVAAKAKAPVVSDEDGRRTSYADNEKGELSKIAS